MKQWNISGTCTTKISCTVEANTAESAMKKAKNQDTWWFDDNQPLAKETLHISEAQEA